MRRLRINKTQKPWAGDPVGNPVKRQHPWDMSMALPCEAFAGTGARLRLSSLTTPKEIECRYDMGLCMHRTARVSLGILGTKEKKTGKSKETG